ncbi:MAG: DNA repair protein RecO [Chloroflexaceae bacterium]|nr:DNA repair protein RecO [Chloroflexaceae bacterium]
MRDRVYRTEALILRRSDVGEADRLLTLCTPAGKQRVAARGVRKTTSRIAGHIELFTHASMMLAIGQNLDIVTQSQVLQAFPTMRSDLSRLSGAYYVAELYDMLTRNEENPQLFALLVRIFALLDTTPRPELALRTFELHFLHLLGYRPQFQQCVVCHTALTEEADRFSPALGGVLCPSHRQADPAALPMSFQAFKVLRFLQKEPVEVVGRLTISAAVGREIERLLRAYLRPILEREPKTIAFLASLGGTGDPPDDECSRMGSDTGR